MPASARVSACVAVRSHSAGTSSANENTNCHHSAQVRAVAAVSSAITGASRVEQVHDNMKALEAASKLTPDVMTEIEKILGTWKKDLND